ncbi:MAG: hypothetical protein R3C01_18270 [Planctomycetaceae bacterium]
MSAVVVACPRCGKELKLRDRSLLGRKGKCPSCSESFLLTEPPEAEVELELANAVPPVGTSARWVPDDAPAPRAVATPGAVVPPITAGPAIKTGGEDGGVERLKQIQKKGAKRRNIAILGGAVMAACIAGAVMFLNSKKQPLPSDPNAAIAQTQTAAVTPAGNSGPPVIPNGMPANVGMPAGTSIGAGNSLANATFPVVQAGEVQGTVRVPHQELIPSRLTANDELVNKLLPTSIKPIETMMVPNGVNVLISLRPAQLWSDDPVWTEIRYSLTEDVTNWIAATLKSVCHREPQQIESCLICIRLGATGTAPEVSTVVHLVEEGKLSDLIEEFRGAPFENAGQNRVNLRDGFAYVLKDTKTFAIAPQGDVYTLAESVRQPNPDVPDAMYELLRHTNPDHVFTVLFQLDDVKRHEDWMFSQETMPVFRRVLDWFGDDVEAVSWSVHVDENAAVSDIRLRTRPTASTSGLARDMVTRLEYLPRELMNACRKMRPGTQGFADIISRFPAMMEAFREATVPVKENRDVRLVTYLPRKAAPNLAIGTILAWSESLRTDFSSSSQVPTTVASTGAPAKELPATAAERLLMVMDAEFNNPFQDAIAYIADETKLTFDIDGNALKDAGFTKNMPQKFSLGKVPAIDAMRQIVLNNRPPSPDKRICFCVDEATKSVLVTTEKFAEAENRTILKLVEE